jgi:DNA-binding NtrC family response regulator
MITAFGDVADAVEAMQHGAFDFLQKGRADLPEIKARLDGALEHSRLFMEVSQLEREIQLIAPRRIVGRSEKIRAVMRMIEMAARHSDVTVLVRGETGTGKELAARALHASGPRKSKPFVPVMLNAIPQEIVEAELFGHEPGAFTGARERRIGYLERAHGGVLLLDEVGEIGPAVQVKLLRFLEEREFQRLGGARSIRIDVQVVATTNSDLEAQVKAGHFRQDLYYRLKGYEVELPPLRERAEDIPLLIEHFLALSRQHGKRVHAISPEAVEVLRRHDWPGNIRQLRNTLDAALFRAELAAHARVEPDDLPSDVYPAARARRPAAPVEEPLFERFDLEEALARAEFWYVERALDAAGGKKAEAGRLLGFKHRFALHRRVRSILEKYPHLRNEFAHIGLKFDQ